MNVSKCGEATGMAPALWCGMRTGTRITIGITSGAIIGVRRVGIIIGERVQVSEDKIA